MHLWRWLIVVLCGAGLGCADRQLQCPVAGRTPARSADFTERGDAQMVPTRSPFEWAALSSPVRWLPGRGYSGAFGSALAYDGSTLVVAAAKQAEFQSSAVYFFNVLSGTDGVIGIDSAAVLSIPSTLGALGNCVASCSGGFVVSSYDNRLLWITREDGVWQLQGVIPGRSNARVDCPMDCSEEQMLVAFSEAGRRYVQRYDLVESQWRPVGAIGPFTEEVQSLVIGSSYAAVGVNGMVYVYDFWDSWEPKAKLEVDGAPHAMSTASGWLYVSVAQGLVVERLLVFQSSGSGWGLVDEWEPGATDLVVQGATVFAGYSAEPSGMRHQVGTVHVYQHADTGWRRVGVIVPPTDVPGQYFGRTLAASERELIIGAPGHTHVSGAVYVLELPLGKELLGVDDAEWKVVPQRRLSPMFYAHGGYVYE